MSIRLSVQSPLDTFYQCQKEEGVFSVKFADWLGMLGHLESYVNSYGPDEGKFWTTIEVSSFYTKGGE